MSSDESGRLFSKVAKFVRNPLKDWSALDAPESLTSAEAYRRAMLKHTLERRQRNDMVRIREFGMLRQLRQREAAGQESSTSSLSLFGAIGLSKSEGRALTLKKIDEIEEQMSQQWWESHSLTLLPDDADAERVAGASAPATTINETKWAAVPEPLADRALVHRSRRLIESRLRDAAVCFARGDDDGSESVLLHAIATVAPDSRHDDSWRALLDLYRSTGAIEKFERLSLRYVQRFERPGPQWIGLDLLARNVLAGERPLPAALPLPPPLLMEDDGWACPAHLTQDSLSELLRDPASTGWVWKLDWRALDSIDVTAVAPLKALFVHWGCTAVHLQFAGGANLLAVLASATPVNERHTAAIWWELRLSALCAMHEADGFEFAALCYCLTYELSPPVWQGPLCSYTASFVTPIPDASKSLLPMPMPSWHAMLAGDMSGQSSTVCDHLDADLRSAGAGTVVISCAALLRMDFTTADALLKWVKARSDRGRPVEFTEAHRLIAVFFEVVGIADHAKVEIRLD